MGSPLSSAAVFLIRTLFELYILIFALRFLLQVVRADFYNPLSQFVVRATNPVLVPLRRIIPGFGGVDAGAVVAMVALKVIELFTLSLLVSTLGAGIGTIVVVSIIELIKLFVYIYIVAIMIQVVISWISPGTYNPMTALINSITEPLMQPARRMIPPMSGFDLSPLAVLIVLQLVLILFVEPLYSLV
jgi:YggT family protein